MLCLASTLACLLAPSSHAALLYYEGFEDYFLGGITSFNGGFYQGNLPGVPGWLTNGWDVVNPGNGTANVTAESGNFTTGNALTVTPTSGAIYARRALVTTLNSGTVYFSLLIDNTITDGSATGGKRFMAMTLQNGADNEALYFGQAAGTNFNWGVFNVQGSVVDGEIGTVGGNQRSSISSNNADATLLVLRVDFDYFDGAAIGDPRRERLRLYVNPDLALGEPTTANVDAYDQFSGITHIRLGAGFTSGSDSTSIGMYDELYITTDWASIGAFAVPEPGRMALLMLAALALTSRRHKIRQRAA